MLYERGTSGPTPYKIIDQRERLREIINETATILKRCLAPDTFMGRKTQEPFPKEAVIKSH
jgi:hypothetical protein